jgi:hypothetical protein
MQEEICSLSQQLVQYQRSSFDLEQQVLRKSQKLQEKDKEI